MKINRKKFFQTFTIFGFLKSLSLPLTSLLPIAASRRRQQLKRNFEFKAKPSRQPITYFHSFLMHWQLVSAFKFLQTYKLVPDKIIEDSTLTYATKKSINKQPIKRGVLKSKLLVIIVCTSGAMKRIDFKFVNLNIAQIDQLHSNETFSHSTRTSNDIFL